MLYYRPSRHATERVSPSARHRVRLSRGHRDHFCVVGRVVNIATEGSNAHRPTTGSRKASPGGGTAVATLGGHAGYVDHSSRCVTARSDGNASAQVMNLPRFSESDSVVT